MNLIKNEKGSYHFPGGLLFLLIESSTFPLLLHGVKNLPRDEDSKASEQHTRHNDRNDGPCWKGLVALFGGLILDQLIVHYTVGEDEGTIVSGINELTLFVHVIRIDFGHSR